MAIINAQAQDDEVIIGLDANAVIGKEAQGLDKLIHEGGLFDLAMDIPNCQSDPLGTYKISGRRLDYILGTAGTRKAVIGGGALSYNEGIFSNHRAIYIDFHLKTLLGNFQEIAPEKRRKVHSKKPVSVSKYKEKLWQCFSE